MDVASRPIAASHHRQLTGVQFVASQVSSMAFDHVPVAVIHACMLAYLETATEEYVIRKNKSFESR
jgi:hypothetical protein